MASSSWPDASAGNVLTDLQYEQITLGTGLSGVLGALSDTAFAYADSGGMYIKVRANKLAYVRGHAYGSGGAEIQVNVAANASGNPRIDTLVLRYDRSTSKITEAIVQGTPAVTPSPPALTQQTGTTGVYEIPLLDIAVANGAATIGPGNVTSREFFLAPGGDALLSRPGRARPTGVPAGARLYEVDLSTNPFTRRLWWDGTQWRLEPGQQLHVMTRNDGSYLAGPSVAGFQDIYTTPTITIEPNQPVEIVYGVPFSSNSSVGYDSDVIVQVSENGGAFADKIKCGNTRGPTATGFQHRLKGVELYKPSSSLITTLAFRFRSWTNATNYDVLCSSMYPAMFAVRTTGRLNSEIS